MTNLATLKPTQPYFIRALYEWCADNHLTPQIIVEVEDDAHDVQVPMAFVKDGHIVLNISMTATQNLKIDNEGISFLARFSGQSHSVFVPFHALRGIFPREHQHAGLFFERDEMLDLFEKNKKSTDSLLKVDESQIDKKEKDKSKSRASLKIVK